jgi:hypothetical protein
MTTCIPPFTEKVVQDNNEVMQSSTSSSGDRYDVSHDKRNEDNQETSSPTFGCRLVPILHGLTHTQLQIEDHGSPGKLNGSCAESMMKKFIKQPGTRTRRFHA